MKINNVELGAKNIIHMSAVGHYHLQTYILIVVDSSATILIRRNG
jgi:hypothetical protein